MSERLRRLPSIDALLERESVAELTARWGQPYAVATCRAAVDTARAALLADDNLEPDEAVQAALDRELTDARLRPVQPVINATGVILHTNLGRAPYNRDMLQEVVDELSGAAAVEIDLPSGKRGVRGQYVRRALARLCGAEDALIVNNNAAAVLIALSALASGKDVIVSRGELIQIGGGFRIPDVIQQGGARLKEVGTTNITSLDDYRAAIDDQTGALLKVHLSNFHQGGFAKRPSTRELASLKTDSLPFIEDLGSGNLLDRFGENKMPDPTPASVLADGADLVCFSGDKLLGGPQAGLIAGRGDLIATLSRYPLMRAIRPDKFTYAMLQQALSAYERGEPERLAPWRFLQQGRESIRKRCQAFLDTLRLPAGAAETVDTFGEYGAGSLPGAGIESAAIAFTYEQPERLAENLRRGDPSVLGFIRDGHLMLDFLAVNPEDEPDLANAVAKALGA